MWGGEGGGSVFEVLKVGYDSSLTYVSEMAVPFIAGGGINGLRLPETRTSWL